MDAQERRDMAILVDALVERAARLVDAEAWDEAAAMCSHIIEIDPRCVAAWNMQCDIVYETRPQDMLDLVDAWIDKAPSMRAHYMRAAVLYGMGRIDDAVATVDDVIYRYEPDADTLALKACLLRACEQYDDAVQYAQLALKLDPNHEAATTEYVTLRARILCG